MAGWATPAWAAQEAGRQKAETAQLRQEVARLRREGEQEAQTIAEMKRDAELVQGVSRQNERLSKDLDAAEARIRELEAERDHRATTDREKETVAAKEKAETELGVRKMERERDENKKAFQMCLAALQTATRKLKGLQTQTAAATAPEKKVTREATCQTEGTPAPAGDHNEDRGREAGKGVLDPLRRPAQDQRPPEGRIPRSSRATLGEGPEMCREGADRHQRDPKGTVKAGGPQRTPQHAPDQQQQDYWRKSQGNKRVKRDHRGREKAVPGESHPKRPPGPTRGPFRPEAREGEYGRAPREVPAHPAEEGPPGRRRGEKRRGRAA